MSGTNFVVFYNSGEIVQSRPVTAVNGSTLTLGGNSWVDDPTDAAYVVYSSWRTALSSLGGPGIDTIDASMSSSGVVIFGGAGDDIITGSQGDDHIAGGAGNDDIHRDRRQ